MVEFELGYKFLISLFITEILLLIGAGYAGAYVLSLRINKNILSLNKTLLEFNERQNKKGI